MPRTRPELPQEWTVRCGVHWADKWMGLRRSEGSCPASQGSPTDTVIRTFTHAGADNFTQDVRERSGVLSFEASQARDGERFPTAGKRSVCAVCQSRDLQRMSDWP